LSPEGGQLLKIRDRVATRGVDQVRLARGERLRFGIAGVDQHANGGHRDVAVLERVSRLRHLLQRASRVHVSSCEAVADAMSR